MLKTDRCYYYSPVLKKWGYTEFELFIVISFPLNILRTSGQNFTKVCIRIDTDKIKLGIATHHVSHICNRVMVLDRCQNFFQNVVSAQYLESKSIEFDQILYAH